MTFDIYEIVVVFPVNDYVALMLQSGFRAGFLFRLLETALSQNDRLPSLDAVYFSIFSALRGEIRSAAQ